MPSIVRRGNSWRARYRVASGRQREKLFSRKADARRFLDEQTAALVTGQYADPSAGKIRFRDYAEQWRKDQLHHRPSTAAQAESRLRLWVYPVIGDQPMSTIDRSDVQRVVTRAASTIEVIYSYVSSVFRAAVVDRVIPSTPCVKINLPEKPKAKVTPLTTEQVGLIADRVDRRYRALVLTAAAAGPRSGELRGITIDRLDPPLHLRGDVPPQQVTLRIDRQLIGIDEDDQPIFGPVKTPAADRGVPVGASIAQLIADHLGTYGPGNGGIIFSAQGGAPISRSRAGHIWRPATNRMNLRPRSGWHDLRHYHASLLIADGRSPRAVADRLSMRMQQRPYGLTVTYGSTMKNVPSPPPNTRSRRSSDGHYRPR